MKAVQVQVHGMVQGVGFRWSCVMEAERVGARGWVRNLPGGQVEAWVEGDDAAVDAVVAWCGQGPRFARVDHVDVTPVAVHGYGDFGVR